jgi:alkylation response protein AidB-like acyl-CoA dehydrogenase
MAGWTLDTQISKESKAMLKEVRGFGADLLRPSGSDLDKLERPSDVYRKESALWRILKAYRALDLHLLQIPSVLGGVDGVDSLALLLIREEMGYGDVGLSLSLIASDLPFICAAMASSPERDEMVRSYGEDREVKMIGSLCLNDPFFSNPSLRAEKQGGHYVINGQVERVANGNFASHLLIYFHDRASAEDNRILFALSPMELSGITRHDPMNKLGQRGLNSNTLTFRDVKLPETFVLTHDTALLNRIKKVLTERLLFDVCSLYSGLGMSAFDEAISYAKERVQGGVPIFNHKNIKLKLFNLFQMIEASRAYARRVSALLPGASLPLIAPHVVSLKVTATRTASDVCCEVMQIFGGNGLAREYPVEKFFRDAQTGRVENGGNDQMAIEMADYL